MFVGMNSFFILSEGKQRERGALRAKMGVC
jgi:hypothetical protein